jgi:hypothetical protein
MAPCFGSAGFAPAKEAIRDLVHNLRGKRFLVI